MTIGLTLLAAIIALPSVVLFLQCVVASWPHRSRPASDDRSPARQKLGVLVPAHDEEAVIADTLASISAQLRAGDRLLVVADNCSDATAHIAEQGGAEVLCRNDSSLRGKGYALQAGLARFGEGTPESIPEIVIVIDADCRLEPGCLDALALCVSETSRPVQACYLMHPPHQPRTVDVISSLAVLVKNRVRPLAMARLGMPCLLTGSGSAFPWRTIAARSFAGDNIVEDMQLAIDLALVGSPPTYCDAAVLTARLPDKQSAFVSQRRRWEHGHLRTLLMQVPRLLAGFFRTGRLKLAAMMVDLAVPPLSLLAAVSLAAVVLASIAGSLGAGWTPALVAAGGLLLLMASAGLAWWVFARKQIALRHLFAAPFYVATKLPIYLAFLFRREQSWIRTARSQNEPHEPVQR